MKVKVIEGALKEELLFTLRSKETPPYLFRESLERLGLLLIGEALKELSVSYREVETPVAPARAGTISQEVVFIAILRAGLSLLPPALSLYPKGRLGFIGAYRNEESLEPVNYYVKFPKVDGAKYFILDPMLATGGTVYSSVKGLSSYGIEPSQLCVVTVVSAPEGIERLREFEGLTLVTASVDEGLNSKGFIVPGLGDAGDRFCGTEGVEVVESYGIQGC
jgi:uracil phosphoribosyltransferase